MLNLTGVLKVLSALQSPLDACILKMVIKVWSVCLKFCLPIPNEVVIIVRGQTISLYP